MKDTIFIKNKKYFYYDSYGTFDDAIKIGKYYNKKNNKNQYFILKAEEGFIFPEIKYRLYMTKVISLC